MRKVEGKHTSRVIIINGNNEVLLSRRANYKSHPDAWHIPGGRSENQENFRQTGIREIEEELGIRIDPKLFIEYISGHKNYIVHCYYALLCDGEPRLASKENTEIAWFDQDTIPELAFSDNFIIALFFDYLRRNEL